MPEELHIHLETPENHTSEQQEETEPHSEETSEQLTKEDIKEVIEEVEQEKEEERKEDEEWTILKGQMSGLQERMNSLETLIQHKMEQIEQIPEATETEVLETNPLPEEMNSLSDVADQSLPMKKERFGLWDSLKQSFGVKK